MKKKQAKKKPSLPWILEIYTDADKEYITLDISNGPVRLKKVDLLKAIYSCMYISLVGNTVFQKLHKAVNLFPLE